MPAFVGTIKIVGVEHSSNVQIGDTAVVWLSSQSKKYGGANSFTTGDSIGANLTNNSASSTNTLDSDLIDNAKVI